MTQQAFEARYALRWDEFSGWLKRDGSKRTKPNAGKSAVDAIEVPARYRELCQHLALARDRQYSADLIERLSRLALSGRRGKLRSRAVDIAYRKPSFAGDQVRAQLRLYEGPEGLGTAGFIAGDDGKPRVYVRVAIAGQ